MNQKLRSAAMLVYRKVYTRIFPDYVRELGRELEGCDSVLDLGCGDDSPLRHLKKMRSEGVDMFGASVEKSMAKNIHDRYHKMDVLDVDRKFAPGSFDCVIALDLIEHLSKSDGLDLLKKMERIAKRKVVVFTPNGFVSQDEYQDNDWQVHKSGWDVNEMKALGYRVIGINGLRGLRGKCARLKYRPKLFWWLVSDITQVFVRDRPEKACQLLCMKEK